MPVRGDAAAQLGEERAYVGRVTATRGRWVVWRGQKKAKNLERQPDGRGGGGGMEGMGENKGMKSASVMSVSELWLKRIQ